MIYHQNQVKLQKDQQFRRYIRKSYFDYMIIYCDLDLEDSKPVFPEDNLAHYDAYHTKFGSKRFSDSENIVWTNN